MSDDTTPQFAMPFRLNVAGTDALTVAEDSEDDVRSCVEVLIRTPVGFFEEAPELGGQPEPFEEGDVDLDEIQSAVSQWEPRADPLIEAHPDFLDALISNINIEARVTDDGR